MIFLCLYLWFTTTVAALAVPSQIRPVDWRDVAVCAFFPIAFPALFVRNTLFR